MRKLLLSLIAFVCLLACKTKAPQVTEIAQVQPSEDTLTKKEVQEMRLYLDGKKALLLDDPIQAQGNFEECLRINPQASAAALELAKIYVQRREFARAAYFIEIAEKASPNQEEVLQNKALIQLANKQSADAIKTYKLLIKRFPNQIQYYLALTSLLEQNRQSDEAIKTLDALQQRFGVQEEYRVRQIRLLEMEGKWSAAEQLAEKLIQSNPKEGAYYAVLLEIYLSSKQEAKFAQCIERMRLACPNDATVAGVLAQYYLQSKRYTESMDALEKVLSENTGNANLNIIEEVLAQLAPVAEAEPQYSARFQRLLDLYVLRNSNSIRAYLMLGDLQAKNKQYSEALNNYQKSVKLGFHDWLIWQQMMLVCSEGNLTDSLMRVSKQALDLFSEQAMPYYFIAQLDLEASRYDSALYYLQEGALRCADNKVMKAQFYSLLGDTYHKVGRHAASDSSYENALFLEPTNVYVMNNYAYYLSQRQYNLSRAHDLAKQAVAQDPKNANFIDTYAWVLFQEGKYVEAKEILLKAIQLTDKNATLWEHYGDIQAKLGEIEQALQSWKTAKDLGAKGNIDQKIAERSYIESK